VWVRSQDALFDLAEPARRRGRVRAGLDLDVKQAHAAGHALSAAGVACLRSLADQLDALERWLRRPGVRPYDRVPLVALQRQFDATYQRVFAGSEVDPLDRAFAEFRAAEAERDAAARADLVVS
jgi:hypothetical protein